jgi:DNA polymerase III subunit delta'
MDNIQPWLQSTARHLLVNQDRFPSALLLHGRPGIGKSGFGKEVAKTLLCEQPTVLGACAKCSSCHWFSLGNHPDFRFVTPGALAALDASEGAADGDEAPKTKAEQAAARSNEIRIDQLRGLASFCAIGSHRGGRRIILVDPAQTMNLEASNTVLKVLEEPTPGLHFILVCQRPQSLLPTIASRCQELVLPAPEAAQALSWLREQTGLPETDAKRLLRRTGDAPLRARQLAEPAQITAYQAALDAIALLPDTSAVEIAAQLGDANASQVLDIAQHWLLDVERVRVGLAPLQYPEAAARLRALAKRTNAQAVVGAHKVLAEQRALVHHPLNARLFLEESLMAVSGVFS